MRDRFDIDLLDDVNPFEIDDDNLPHMFKHGPGVSGGEVGLDTLDEIYVHDEPRFYEAAEDGPADWLMLGHVSGEVLMVRRSNDDPVAEHVRTVTFTCATDIDQVIKSATDH